MANNHVKLNAFVLRNLLKLNVEIYVKVAPTFSSVVRSEYVRAYRVTKLPCVTQWSTPVVPA